VARYADACNLFDIPDGGRTIKHKLDVLARHCDAVGRPYEAIEKTLSTRLEAGEPADEFVRRGEAVAALGIEHVSVITSMAWTAQALDTLAAAIPALAPRRPRTSAGGRIGPIRKGDRKWDAILHGECRGGYCSPWPRPDFRSGVASGGAAKNQPATGPLTDVDHMRAMHNALRRGLARLDSVVLHPAGPAQLSPQPAQACADLRGRLDRHHVARDADLWPVLRRQLADLEDQPHIDRMVDEHRKLSTLIMKGDDAITNETDASAAFAALAAGVRDHLADEERHVVPLLERHLSPAQWRAFLV
jgi:hemerythrin-like domain-containing protein